MRLRWRPRALNDLNAIFDYIAQFNPAAAEIVVKDIDRAARRLKTLPQLGRPSHKTDLRLLQVPGRPYLLPYSIIGDVIEIFAVVDERRERPPEWT